MKTIIKSILSVLIAFNSYAQMIPIDTTNWKIEARSYVIEPFNGVESIYLQGGTMTLKEKVFLNGTIEFDLYLKEEPSFPGVYFRARENGDAEQFYLRPHQSGNPDANQAAPTTKNITPWQLYFGERYSFPYDYKFDNWTHVKIMVKDEKAQVFLDKSEVPHLSWELFTSTKAGKIVIRGGNKSGLHIANVRVSHDSPSMFDFSPIERTPISGLIESWEVSDMFSEDQLDDIAKLPSLINERKWSGSIRVEEGTAANISRVHNRFDGSGNNTVFAKIVIESNKDQVKQFDFGYSDRVVAILNGHPIYTGTNRWRSRDYRYLGTIGLFDGIYLPLKKGKNELVMAVSEDFGGWLITGKFQNMEGIKIR